MRRTAVTLSALCFLACGDDDSPGGTPDASTTPAVDAAIPDAAPPDAAGPDADPSLPNLILLGDRIADSIIEDDRDFFQNDCAVVEGCAYPGHRRLLRFSTVTMNAGGSDLVVGVPGEFGGAGQWQWSDCHGHYHFSGYALYELVDANGDVVMAQDGPAVGRKQAFCLEDTDRISADAKPESFNFCQAGSPDPQCIYNCDYQGISAGWADTYNINLTCQWLDICGVPEGDYFLRISVNTMRVLGEGNYNDNVFTTPVTIGPPPANQPDLCQ